MALTIPGVDYAWGAVPYDIFRQHGIKFAMRYVSHDPGKDLSLSEKHELNKRGIAVGLVFESTSDRALQGHAAGAQDAKAANARAKQLAMFGVPIYFGVDFDATDAQKPRVADYLNGCASVLGRARVGVYGSYYVVEYMHDHRVCDWFWQTYAWSGGHLHPAADVYQWKNGADIGGLSCDLDRASSRGLRSMRGGLPVKRPDPRLGKWKRQLRLLRGVAKFLGWVPAVRRAADNRKKWIKEHS